MTVTETDRPTSFEHVNLKEVQPTTSFGDRSPIPDGPYNLEVVKASLVDYTCGENTKTPGVKGQRIDFQFAIVGDASLSGRRVFQPGLFPGDKTNDQLRRVMDATGIPQTGTIESWLSELVAQKARFNAPVENYTDVYFDPPKERTKVNLWRPSPYQG